MNRILLTAGLSVLASALAYGRTSESLNATWSGTVFPEKGKKTEVDHSFRKTASHLVICF